MHRNDLKSVFVQVLGLILLSSAFLHLIGTSAAQAQPKIVLGAAPDSVAPTQKTTISWEVQGTGKVAHTAVHWDTKPGNPADFTSYAKATPDFAALNPPDDAPKQYVVTFDAPASGTVYYIVHAIVDGKNVYNPEGERKITVGDAMMEKDDAMKKGDAMTQQAGTYGGLDTTMPLGIGAVVVVGVVAVVAVTRRGKK